MERNESLFGYLHRWWRWLVLASAVGALSGLGYAATQPQTANYIATATLAMENPQSQSETPPAVVFEVDSGKRSTEDAAVADVATTVGLIVGYSAAPVVVQHVSIDPTGSGSIWWKDVVMGSAIGVLLAIGVAYLWEDAKSFQQRRERLGPSV